MSSSFMGPRKQRLIRRMRPNLKKKKEKKQIKGKIPGVVN